LPDYLIVFAKEPRPGYVKTRLFRRGGITPEQAAEIHLACVRDTLALASRSTRGKCWLLVAAPPARAQRFAASLRLDKQWTSAPQRGADLGARLLRALRAAFRRGATRIVVIGTDTPWMGAERIRDAFRALERSDIVLGSTDDGGYYLVGVRKLVPKMFRGIAWSTPRVLPQTLRALHRARASVTLLPRDFDLDRPPDLARVARMLRRKAQRSPALARCIKELKRSGNKLRKERAG
jgi:hypothetical protein